VRPVRRDVRHGEEEHAQQQDKAGRLGADGQKRGGRDRRALVNIRNPDLERHHRNLEAQPREDQHQAKEENPVAAQGARGPGQPVEAQGMRQAIHQRDAKDHEGGREGADDQVFHAGFERRHPVALEAGEDVEGDGDQFKRGKEQGEVVGRGGKQHAGEGKENQGVILGKARRDAVGELDRQEQDEERRQQEEALEEERQSIQHIHLAERIAGRALRGHPHADQAVEQDQARAQRGDVAEFAFGRERQP